MFHLRKGNIYAIPAIHYKMESAACVFEAFHEIQPDCVAVELPENLSLQFLHAASRLPDLGVIQADELYWMCEPCDPAFEGLRCALENKRDAYCIDLDVKNYPDIYDPLPDPYAIQRIGLETYYKLYKKVAPHPLDHQRELYMARRLKELSLKYEKVLFVGGMHHIERVLELTEKMAFPEALHAERQHVQLFSPTETSSREIMAESGWISQKYEQAREEKRLPLDRQKLIYSLYKESATPYQENSGNEFPGYHLRNTMKFARNYALIVGKLLPDLFQILSAAKGCVDHNYAYETWVLATEYPYLRNIDNLPTQDFTVDQIWKDSKVIRFHPKAPSRKSNFFDRRKKDLSKTRFKPPGPFSICSYPPEDTIVEKFGEFLKKKGTQILTEDAARTAPFSTSLEDGIDTKETIRHWSDKKLYVKVKGKPPGGVGSVVMIFDEDSPEEGKPFQENYSWKTTWLGEHSQESDMAFYSTSTTENVVGPGISRCEYGGFMMSYPPRRLFDIWHDPDYAECRTKAEVLLMAAIDYAVKPIVVYVAAKPPRSQIKSFAKRYGKKVVYIPIGQLSPVTLNKLRAFHVLDGHDKRDIAGEYIY